MALLSVENITRKEEGNVIVQPLSFELPFLKKMAIVGETGSGKTTLLKMIAGLVQPDGGMIRLSGEKVAGPLDRLLPGHPKIAYLSQHFELRNNYRIEELLEMSNRLSAKMAQLIYSVCRIDHLLKRKNDALSGGEKQRIALAGLLTTSPQLLLLDEPFSNLDRVHKTLIQSVIEDIGEELQITCLMVSHDAGDTLSWADEIKVMKDGYLVQSGSPQELYFKPVNEYVAGLLGEYNLIDTSLHPSFIQLLQAGAATGILLLRPEQFKIHSFEKENEKSIPAIVKQVMFYGSYYLAIVLVGQLQIKVKTDKGSFTKGEIVRLSLSLVEFP